MHSAVRAVPATITDLVVDLASTPLSELLSGDLAGSVCGEVADALGVAGVLCDSDRVVVAGWSDPRAWSLACLQAEQRDGEGMTDLPHGQASTDRGRPPRAWSVTDGSSGRARSQPPRGGRSRSPQALASSARSPSSRRSTSASSV